MSLPRWPKTLPTLCLISDPRASISHHIQRYIRLYLRRPPRWLPVPTSASKLLKSSLPSPKAQHTAVSTTFPQIALAASIQSGASVVSKTKTIAPGREGKEGAERLYPCEASSITSVREMDTGARFPPFWL